MKCTKITIIVPNKDYTLLANEKGQFCVYGNFALPARGTKDFALRTEDIELPIQGEITV